MPPTAGPLIHVMSYGPDGVEESTPTRLVDARALRGRRAVTWLNVNRATDPEMLASLERDFGVHALTVEDIRNTLQRPKVERYRGYTFVVTQMVELNGEGVVETEQLVMLLGPDWLITVQEAPGDVFEPVRARIRQGSPNVRGAPADVLVHQILDAIVDAYFPALATFSDRAEALEEVILSGEDRDVRGELQSLRRDLLELKRVAWPQRDALLVLERSDLRWISAGTRTFLRDVSDHATRVIDFVETNRELVASLMDLHLANLTHRTNEAMRVLTVVATIFIPLTFIVGVYGMNFDFMPELRARWGYPAVMAFMAAVGVAMYAHFRRRGWV